MAATADNAAADAAQHASGSSFYLAMRILPRAKREVSPVATPDLDPRSAVGCTGELQGLV